MLSSHAQVPLLRDVIQRVAGCSNEVCGEAGSNCATVFIYSKQFGCIRRECSQSYIRRNVRFFPRRQLRNTELSTCAAGKRVIGIASRQVHTHGAIGARLLRATASDRPELPSTSYASMNRTSGCCYSGFAAGVYSLRIATPVHHSYPGSRNYELADPPHAITHA